MANRRLLTARNPVALAGLLGLKPSDAYQWEVQATLLARLKEIVAKEKLTHAEVASKAKTSRTRITAILNSNLRNVSTDLLIRVVGALGYSVNVSVRRARAAA